MKNPPKKSFNEITEQLRMVRSNQPRVTLQEAQEQAARVMKAKNCSTSRARKLLNTDDICDAENAALIHAVVKAAAQDMAK